MADIPELYDVARRVCHEAGMEWTDPRTATTYPAPPCACARRSLLRHVERAPIDDADPIAHTAFYLLVCPACRIVTVFPVANLALLTAEARVALHLDLAAQGWWLPFEAAP